ncbi:hypothetical protein [Craterilacuibacter sp. RT1T]|uniref:hypothetical protein n=1 Tax=Craterilacuibacter sp. RT1T TaxID=2942211 RepID=UPI0020BF0789|nr:hypothetical protein [Craterilacuibacter sp. RT1T]MCL6262712.1 hypothetical protein [Craterilacuibacter sp. RT1T]
MSTTATIFGMAVDLDSWVKWATIAVPAIAIPTAFIAFFQVKISRAESRIATAHNIYNAYLQLAMQNPDLASADSNAIASSPMKYKWFLASMLFSFEQILLVTKNQNDWVIAIKSQLKKHKNHLSVSGSVARGDWKPELARLIKETVKG